MADILNQALKDANYNVTNKNKNPAVYYKITSYSLTRPDPTSDDIQYSVTVSAFMNSGGSMGSGTPLDLKIQLSILNGGIIFDKYIKQSSSWSGRGDSTATATVTFTGTTNIVAEGTQTIKFLGYRPNQNSDVISSSNPAPGTTIGSGEVVNSSYTMNFPAKSYTVTFDANGGTTANPSSITKSSNAELGTLPTTSRTGYTFNGWYTARTGGTKISTTTKVTGNATYYAQWTINQYTITYHSQGGTEPSGFSQSQTEDYGNPIVITSEQPTMSGYEFIGWNTSADGSGTWYYAGNYYTDYVSVTLYAQWEFLPYHVNIGGEWVPCAVKVNVVVDEGYIYLGESEDYQGLSEFNQSMYERYGIGCQGNEDIFYATRGDIPGIPFTDIADDIVWWQEAFDQGSGYSLYMKSNNVKQWVDCTIQSL